MEKSGTGSFTILLVRNSFTNCGSLHRGSILVTMVRMFSLALMKRELLPVTRPDKGVRHRADLPERNGIRTGWAVAAFLCHCTVRNSMGRGIMMESRD